MARDTSSPSHDPLTTKVLRRPERAGIAAPVQEQPIVGLYTK
jgi:small subunit ribosomal protein S4